MIHFDSRWKAFRRWWRSQPLRRLPAQLGGLLRGAGSGLLHALQLIPWSHWDYLRLLRALPALLLGAAALVLAALLLLDFGPELRARYLERGKACLEAGKFAEALRCYERLAYQHGEQPEVRFGLAQALEGLGQHERTLALMGELAPADRQGYGEAHWWWARRRLNQPGAARDARQEAERHLLCALQGELHDRSAVQGLLGELYLAENKLQEAEPLLQEACKNLPGLRLRLATLYVLAGKGDLAGGEAREALTFFRLWATAEPREPQPRLQWAETALFLEKYADAVAILGDGLRASNNPVYRTALARAYVRWSDGLARNAEPDPGRQLGLLEKALEYDPAHTDLLMRLWSFTRVRGEAAEKARAVLRSQLALGRGHGLVHLALGMDAWERKRQDEALVHLEEAYRLAPNLGLVANNLAWVLASAQPPDLERALGLMNTVVRRWPDDPVFRDTRAQVLARQGNWRAALTDQQAALPAFVNRPEFHRRLAESYRNLNMEAMADEHERQARRAGAEQGKANP